MGCNNKNIKFNRELILVNSKARNCSFIQNCFWRVEAILKSQTKHDWKLNFHFWNIVEVFLARKKPNQTHTKINYSASLNNKCFESAQHLFISCDFFGTLWHHVRQWLGLSGVDHTDIGTHFAQFTNYLDGRRRCRSFLQLLWLMCVWLIWKERNNRVFTNVHISIEELKEKVIFHSYWWLKANNASFVYGCEQWRSDPLFCLGIGWCSFLYLSLYTSCILNALFCTSCALEAYPSLVIYSILASSKKNVVFLLNNFLVYI